MKLVKPADNAPAQAGQRLEDLITECCQIYTTTIEAELRAAWGIGSRINKILASPSEFGLTAGAVCDQVSKAMGEHGSGVDTYTLRRMARFNKSWDEDHLNRTIERGLTWSKVRSLLEVAERGGDEKCEEAEEKIKELPYSGSQPIIAEAVQDARDGNTSGSGGHRRPSDPHTMFKRFGKGCQKLMQWSEDLAESVQDFYAMGVEKQKPDDVQEFLRELKSTKDLIEHTITSLEAT